MFISESGKTFLHLPFLWLWQLEYLFQALRQQSLNLFLIIHILDILNMQKRKRCLTLQELIMRRRGIGYPRILSIYLPK